MTEQAQLKKRCSGRVHGARLHSVLSRAGACVTLYLSLSPLNAQRTQCTQQTMDQLEAASDNIHDWLALRAFFHRYQQCHIEDAEVETAVGGFVTRTLTRHWESLPIAASLFREDPPFEKFALAGLNTTESTDDLNRINYLAAKHCRADLHATCRKVRQAIRHSN